MSHVLFIWIDICKLLLIQRWKKIFWTKTLAGSICLSLLLCQKKKTELWCHCGELSNWMEKNCCIALLDLSWVSWLFCRWVLVCVTSNLACRCCWQAEDARLYPTVWGIVSFCNKRWVVLRLFVVAVWNFSPATSCTTSVMSCYGTVMIFAISRTTIPSFNVISDTECYLWIIHA
jgi:hypothetical protein